MGTPELSGLVDPSQPLDPAAMRALAAREVKRLGPTPGETPGPPPPTYWAHGVRAHFAHVDNPTANEILDCVLDPVYSTTAPPIDASRRLRVYQESAIDGSHLRDRMHIELSCVEALPGRMSSRAISDTIWNLTAGFTPCAVCLVDPIVASAYAVQGLDRHRVDLRTDILTALTQLQSGQVHWPAVHRLANRGTERWAPRYVNGFVDTGNPDKWAADPVAFATVELAVAVGHATGQHLAALWDAAMIDVLSQHGLNGSSARVRRKASIALAAVVEGHSWDELSSVVAKQVDTALTRRKAVEKRVRTVMKDFEPAIAGLVADELERIEQLDHPMRQWGADLTRPNAPDGSMLHSRLVMSWHGGPVPDTVVRAINSHPG